MASMMLQRAPVLRPHAAVSAGRPVIAKRFNLRPVSRKTTVSPQAFFFGGGGNKSSGSQFYICVDCGYIYDGMAGPWNEIPSYFRCPACNSPKSRFKVYKGDDVKGKPNNSKATMQKRMKEKKW